MEASSRDVQGQGEDSMKVYYRGMSLAMNALFGSRAVVQGQGKSMEVFREGICLVINSWWPIRAYVKFGCGGPQPELRLYRFCDRLFSCFIQSKDQLLCIPLIKIALKDLLTSFAGHPLDNSTEEVCDQLVAMYQECLEGDFSSIQIIKEANSRRLMWKQANNNFELENDPFMEKMKQANLTKQDRICGEMLKHARKTLSLKKKNKKKKIKKANLSQTRLLTQKEETPSAEKIQEIPSPKETGMETSSTPSVEIIHEANTSCLLMQKQEQANSSFEMDYSNLPISIRVFKKGVDFLMENLWVRHVFIHKKCGSEYNHSLMLQQFADYILFWFTQTIKPLSFDYIERILRNEMYSLPVAVDNDDAGATNAIIKEVAKKLMVMHEECLQDNFSSVKILWKDSLSWTSCSTSLNETTGQSNIDSEILLSTALDFGRY